MPGTDTGMGNGKKMEELFEMGYNSEGDLPFFGDMDLEIEMMNTYAETASQNENEMPVPAQQEP